MELQFADLFQNVDAADLPVEETVCLNIERIKALTLSRVEEKQGKKNHSVRKLFLAAAIAATLAVTALAYAEFRKYDHPREMLDGFFGNTQQESLLDATGPYGQVPDSIRVPLNLEAAKAVEPFIGAVQEVRKQGDFRLTVHGNLYDSVTGCGILYYTLENPNGIDYQLQFDGSLWGLPIYSGTRHGYCYLLKEKSTDTRLEIAEYYIRGPHDEENYIECGLNAPNVEGSREQEFATEQSAVQIPLNDGGGMAGLTGGGVRLSPIGIYLDGTKMDFLGEAGLDGAAQISISLKDGTEYVLKDEHTQNDMFAAGQDTMHMVMPFNRLVDVGQVEAVILDGHAIRELQPIQDGDRWRYADYVDVRSQLDSLESAGTGTISGEGVTLTSEGMEYSAFTGSAVFTCTLKAQDPEKLTEDGQFLPWEAGLEENQPVRWEVLEQKGKSIRLKGYFTALSTESPYLKLWFAGSNADPRLNQSTENLLCLPLTDTVGEGITLAEGKILVSQLGAVIDYGALEIRQGSEPKHLSVRFTDGEQRIISDWDENILDCAWLNGRELRDSREQKVFVTFLKPLDVNKIQSLTYAGHTFEAP